MLTADVWYYITLLSRTDKPDSSAHMALAAAAPHHELERPEHYSSIIITLKPQDMGCRSSLIQVALNKVH